MKHGTIILGEKINLRPISEEDENLLVSWRNAPHISNQMFSAKGPTLDEHRAWFKSYMNSNDRQEFCICIQESGAAIGTIGLSGINPYHGKAEYGILIGSKSNHGKGYAKEASFLLLNYAFKGLGLRKVTLRVFASNKSAIRLYEQLGFIQEGCLKRDFLKSGVFQDVILMAIFSDECEILTQR